MPGARRPLPTPNEYLSKHPLKDEQDISDLARNGKEKAIAEALKARFGKHP